MIFYNKKKDEFAEHLGFTGWKDKEYYHGGYILKYLEHLKKKYGNTGIINKNSYAYVQNITAWLRDNNVFIEKQWEHSKSSDIDVIKFETNMLPPKPSFRNYFTGWYNREFYYNGRLTKNTKDEAIITYLKLNPIAGMN